MINSVSYLPSLANTDHICLRMDIKCYATMAQTDTSKLNVNKGNYKKFREDLSSVGWYEELHSLNFIQSWDYFSDIFNSILKACVPTVKNYSSRRNLYKNHEARRQTKLKQQLWSKYTRTHDYYDYARYATARNNLRGLTRTLRRNHEQALATNIKGNPKTFWKYVNSRMRTRSKVDDLLREDGTLATTDEEGVITLNKFFCSVFTLEDTTVVPSLPLRPTETHLQDVTITEEAIRKKLLKLDPHKSPVQTAGTPES